jgi:hypothetical protein
MINLPFCCLSRGGEAPSPVSISSSSHHPSHSQPFPYPSKTTLRPPLNLPRPPAMLLQHFPRNTWISHTGSICLSRHLHRNPGCRPQISKPPYSPIEGPVSPHTGVSVWFLLRVGWLGLASRLINEPTVVAKPVSISPDNCWLSLAESDGPVAMPFLELNA